MRVAILHVPTQRASIKHRYRWIDSATQFTTVDAVCERCLVAVRVCVGLQRSEFINQFRGHNVVSVQGQHPGGFNSSLFESEVPLGSMAVKFSLEDSHVGKTRDNLQRLVLAVAI